MKADRCGCAVDAGTSQLRDWNIDDVVRLPRTQNSDALEIVGRRRRYIIELAEDRPPLPSALQGREAWTRRKVRAGIVGIRLLHELKSERDCSVERVPASHAGALQPVGTL